MKANIVPVKLWPGTATQLLVLATNIHLYNENGQAKIDWSLLDENDNTIHCGNTELAGNDYAAWGEDDTYLLTFLADKNNLTLA